MEGRLEGDMGVYIISKIGKYLGRGGGWREVGEDGELDKCLRGKRRENL